MTSSQGPAAGASESRWLGAGLAIVGLTLIAMALRFWRLGDWNFEATEMFTLRDSVTPQWRNTRPLGYLLNYYLVRPFRPLDEFGLRVVPATAGVVAVPILYLVGRRLVGARAALFSALLLTVSGLHVFYSQFARYWSLVFLFCAIYPYALYLGVRDGNRGALAIGVITAGLAILAHPVSILLIGGPTLWLAFTYLRPGYLKAAWKQTRFRWIMALAGLLVAVTIARLVPLLQDWISMHDRNPGMGQFLLVKKGPVVKQFVLLAGYAEALTLPVVLGGAVGVYLLWRERERTLGLFLASLAVFHLAFIALLSIRTPVSTFYFLPTAPVFFLGAGVFLDRLFKCESNVRPRWIVAATVLIVFITAGAPTLVSQYRNGRRFDFRGVAQWLEPRLSTGDVVFSDQPMVLDHYLPGPQVRKLRRDPTGLEQAVKEVADSQGKALWVVAPAPAHAFRTNLKPGGLADWMWANCQMRNNVGRGRVDFRQQYLQVYRCPPALPVAAREESAGG